MKPSLAPLLLLALPFAELYVMIRVGAAIGALNTILLLVLGGAVGLAILREQGFATLRRVQALHAAGIPPERELAAGALKMLGGLLLLVPGFLTDLAALVCLLPVSRRWLLAHLRTIAPGSGSGSGSGSGPRVIEGEFERDDDRRPPRAP